MLTDAHHLLPVPTPGETAATVNPIARSLLYDFALLMAGECNRKTMQNNTQLRVPLTKTVV